MLFRFIRKFLNRRKTSERYSVQLTVRAEDSAGILVDVLSEDVSERGIRLKFEDRGIGDVVGGRDEIPLEICLGDDVPPVRVEAVLVWAFSDPNGATVSGWQFTELKGRSLRRFRSFIDQTADERADEEDESS